MQGGISFVDLFWQADLVVKSVMMLLALASLACWTVIFEKVWHFAGLRRHVGRLERAGAQGQVAGQGAEVERSGLSAVLAAAAREAARDVDPTESRSERRERIERAMRVALGARLRRAEWGLPLLATVGSAAPFVGLFGTVWGIMNSFTSIAQSQDTSLAVVAPGIAEALFATALGLAAAIPAVVAYNKLSTDLGRVSARAGSIIAVTGDRLARERTAPRAVERAMA